ncbi:MAG: hypothetical protein QW568_02250 [Candidatus Anstonellaceae archaeon]
MAKKPEKTSAEVLKDIDYSLWFTDSFAEAYVGSFPSRFNYANYQQQWHIYNEAKLVLAVYSVLVYKVYPKNKRLQDKISSSQEMKSNFEKIKSWLDTYGLQPVAEQMEKQILAGNAPFLR